MARCLLEDMWLFENCVIRELFVEVSVVALFGFLRGLKTDTVYGMIAKAGL